MNMDMKASFLNEADELLHTIHERILMLEQHPEDQEHVDHVFRAAHTLKGSANLYDFSGIAILTHLLEEILDDLRNRARTIDAVLTDMLLESFDQVRELVNQIRDGAEDPQSEPGLLHRLSAMNAKAPERETRRTELFSESPADWVEAARAFMNGEKDAAAFAHYFAVTAALEASELKPNRTQVRQLRAVAKAVANVKSLTYGSGESFDQIRDAAGKLSRMSERKYDHADVQTLFLQMLLVIAIMEEFARRSPTERPSWWDDACGGIQSALEELADGRIPVRFPDVVLDVWDLCKPLGAFKQEFGTLLEPEFEEEFLDWHEDAELEPADSMPTAGYEGLAPAVAEREKRVPADDELARRLIVEQLYFLAPKGRPLTERWSLARDILGRCAAALGDETLRTLAEQAAPDIAALKEAVGRYVVTSTASVPPRQAESEAFAEAAAAAEAVIGEAVPAKTRTDAEPVPARAPESDKSEYAAADRDKIIRVETSKVERLMELIGELAIAKNSFPYLIRNLHLDTAAAAAQLKERYAVLDRISKDLQDAIVDIRMLPFSQVFGKFNRFVRDTARQSGKQIRLEFEGEETTLDKTIVEAISDPLVHLIRNAIDHGIEPSEQRLKAGKPAEGLLRIQTAREGNRIILEVIDDGAGIDAQRIQEKLLAHNALPKEQISRMTREELIPYIFQSGFSTVQEVTSLSGRGIGMSVVQTSIAKLRGRISVSSEQGQGTKVRIELPLTLSMTQILQVTVRGLSLGIPLDEIEETVRIQDKHIQTMQGEPIVTLRDTVYPIIDLGAYFQLPEKDSGANEYLVILKNGLALKVDSLAGQQEVVVKPPEDGFKHLAYLAGVSILGDGKVLLIVNANAIPFAKAGSGSSV